MKVVHDHTELQAALREQQGTRAAVMTMGALHEGHLSLVRKARELADFVVVTVFVNPLQFGPKEDLHRYPRDLPGDLEVLEPLMDARDIVFAPSSDEMYPEGHPEVRVSAGPLGTILEGEVRPGHFDGVLTAVLKFIHLIRPDVAVFGGKDAQQVALIRKMVEDLGLPTKVVETPIVRELDGLAMSSRNAYLASMDRRRAVVLSKALAVGAQAAENGAMASEVVDRVREELGTKVDSVDYVVLVGRDFEPVAETTVGPARLLIAARVGGTRLIDNATVMLRSAHGGGPGEPATTIGG